MPSFGLAADVSGTWKAEFDTQIGRQRYTFTLNQDGTNLTGKAKSEVRGETREARLEEGRVEGDAVSFVEFLSFQGNQLRIAYHGQVTGGQIQFTRKVGDFAVWKNDLYLFAQRIFR